MMMQIHSGSTRGKALLDIVLNLIQVVESIFLRIPYSISLEKDGIPWLNSQCNRGKGRTFKNKGYFE